MEGLLVHTFLGRQTGLADSRCSHVALVRICGENEAWGYC